VEVRTGIANQTGPESCVADREVRDQALHSPVAGHTAPMTLEYAKFTRVTSLDQSAEAAVAALRTRASRELCPST